MNAQLRPVAEERPELVLGIDRFGESAPAAQLAAELGLTPQVFCTGARALLECRRPS